MCPWEAARSEQGLLLGVLTAVFWLTPIFCFSHPKKNTPVFSGNGLNAVAADKGDKITHAHCHGNLQQLLFALDVSLLFGVSADVWFWLRLAWELPRSGRLGFGYELCHECGATGQFLAFAAPPWSRVCFCALCCEPRQCRLHLESIVSAGEEASEKEVCFQMNFITVLKRNHWVSAPSTTIVHVCTDPARVLPAGSDHWILQSWYGAS